MHRRLRVSALAAILGCACGGEGTAGASSTATTGQAADTGASEPTGEAPGSTSGTSSTTAEMMSTEVASTGPASVCDGDAVCLGASGCSECSLADICADELAACLATPGDECNNYANCTGACADDPACIEACYAAHPDGYDPSWALYDCSLCDACPTSCSAFAEYCAVGGGPGKTGTCDSLAECGQCAACSVGSSCAAAAQACTQDPQCQPYQQCIQACAEGDKPCLDACEEAYPGGYKTAWAQFDCAVCSACPASCAVDQPYCQAGGGGPHNECASNADCVELYDSLPFCVERRCIECLSTDNCFFDGSLCVAGFCT